MKSPMSCKSWCTTIFPYRCSFFRYSLTFPSSPPCDARTDAIFILTCLCDLSRFRYCSYLSCPGWTCTPPNNLCRIDSWPSSEWIITGSIVGREYARLRSYSDVHQSKRVSFWHDPSQLVAFFWVAKLWSQYGSMSWFSLFFYVLSSSRLLTLPVSLEGPSLVVRRKATSSFLWLLSRMSAISRLVELPNIGRSSGGESHVFLIVPCWDLAWDCR